MSQPNETLPDRPDEAALNEQVWVHHPGLKTKPKQVTRGKLAILARSGYEEYTDEPPAGSDEPVHSAAAENVDQASKQSRPGSRSAETDQTKES